jgi:hypothetical protein
MASDGRRGRGDERDRDGAREGEEEKKKEKKKKEKRKGKKETSSNQCSRLIKNLWPSLPVRFLRINVDYSARGLKM